MRHIVALAFVFLAGTAAAQPTLSVSPSEVPSGGSVTVTITGTPGLYWALAGSSRDNGLNYGGAALALGTNVQVLATGFFDPSGTVTMPFVPPLANGIDTYFLQAVSSSNPNFVPLTPSNPVAVRPRGFYANAPTFASGLSAGGARITSLGTPSAPSDAATKSYVDVTAAVLGPGIKQSKASGTPLVDLEQTSTGDLLSLRVNATNVGGYPPLLARQQFRFMADGGFVAKGDLGIGFIPATGPGWRTMWHPFKGAFRTGGVDGTQWDDANIGFYSLAVGYNTRATGYVTLAFGDQAEATASHAVAFGASTVASGTASFAAGGITNAAGFASVAMGYTSVARGQGSVALGYRVGACGDYTVALGHRATNDPAQTGVTSSPCSVTSGTSGYEGVFLFGDQSTTANLTASANNQFSARAAGGYRLFTNASMTTGLGINAGGASWVVISDRNAKYAIEPLDERDVLRRLMDLPLSSFLYKDGDGRRYIGPMAQDFHAAFGLGTDDTRIAMNDVDGVALAALKALGADVQALRDALTRLSAENAALQRTVDELQRRLDAPAAPQPR